MNAAAARVLVACDSAQLAAPVLQALAGTFEALRSTTGPEHLAADFAAWAPDVLVFAFASLERAEHVRRDLLRHGRSVPGCPYRTLILCGEPDRQAAFELCLQGRFDDFVPWTAGAYDTQRLVTGVRGACRELAMPRASMPEVSELLAHVRHLHELEQVIERGFADAASRPADAWLARFREPIEAALAGTRALVERVANIRPLVMVVDDDPLARQLIGRALDRKAFDLRFADDGVEALSQMRRLRPDVILMDVRMPGLDGVLLTQRLKSEPRLAAIPVILMTGDSRRETLASSIEAGAAAFLLKPYTRESLTVKLEKVLGPRPPPA
jgi:CheY-like chemotaxis protein